MDRGGRQLDAHMRFLRGAGARWKGIDQRWVSVYGFLEAPSKAAAPEPAGAETFGVNSWPFEVGLRPKLLIEGRILLLRHWKLSFFNKWFRSVRAQRRTLHFVIYRRARIRSSHINFQIILKWRYFLSSFDASVQNWKPSRRNPITIWFDWFESYRTVSPCKFPKINVTMQRELCKKKNRKILNCRFSVLSLSTLVFPSFSPFVS